jgi:hypothetical protein
MNTASVEITGTLNTEGVLTLDGKPPLPAGRVRVTLQPIDVDLTKTEIWQFLERLHAEQIAAGCKRSAEEIDADIEARRREEDEYEREIERVRSEAGRPSS